MPFMGASNDSTASFRSLQMKQKKSFGLSKKNSIVPGIDDKSSGLPPGLTSNEEGEEHSKFRRSSVRASWRNDIYKNTFYPQRSSSTSSLISETPSRRDSSVDSMLSNAQAIDKSMDLDDVSVYNFWMEELCLSKLYLLKRGLKLMKDKNGPLLTGQQLKKRLFLKEDDPISPAFLLNLLEDISVRAAGKGQLFEDDFILPILKFIHLYIHSTGNSKDKNQVDQNKALIDYLAIPFFAEHTHDRWRNIPLDITLPYILLDNKEPYQFLSTNKYATELLELDEDSNSTDQNRNLLNFVDSSFRETIVKLINNEELVSKFLVPFKINDSVSYTFIWIRKIGECFSLYLQKCKEFNTIELDINLTSKLISKVIEQTEDSNEEFQFDNLKISDLSLSFAKIFNDGKDHTNCEEQKFFTFKQYNSKQKRNFPMINLSNVLTGESFTSKLYSLPIISGVLMVNSKNLTINNGNQSFTQQVFGWDIKDLKNTPMRNILPSLHEILDYTLLHYHDLDYLNPDNSNLVLPHHFLRKVQAEINEEKSEYYYYPGLQAFHRDGGVFSIDVQIHVIDTNTMLVYMTNLANEKSFFKPDIEVQEQNNLSIEDTGLNSNSQEKDSMSQSSLNDVKDFFNKDRSQFLKDGLYKVDKEFIKCILSTEENIGTSSVMSPTESISSLPGINIASSMDTEIGVNKKNKKLSDFIVLNNLGSGAFGTVSLCLNKREKYVVIIKTIFKDKILAESWVKDEKWGEIPSEVSILALFHDKRHENILELIDFFEDDDNFYIESPMYGNDGCVDLFDILETNQKMTETEKKLIFKQIVSAVRHAHNLGIAHRDIKEQNIIIDSKGYCKLIDFGSAVYTNCGPFLSFTGTLDYAAPEIIKAMAYEGKPQDIWALGVLLYTIMYRHLPFENVENILEAKIDFSNPEVEISCACQKLISKMLNFQVRDRPDIEQVFNDEWLTI